MALDSDGSASSSSESVASTEELSFVEASPETASSQVRGVSGEGETVERGQAPGAVQYRAVDEGLVVRCVDGQAVIPFAGLELGRDPSCCAWDEHRRLESSLKACCNGDPLFHSRARWRAVPRLLRGPGIRYRSEEIDVGS